MTDTAANGYVPHAAGYVDNDGPKLVSARFVHEDSYTLARSEATDGYQGLRSALYRTPAQVHDEVREATVLGRGGAGFPAGIKWGFMPPGKFPYYLVVNGDESEPGTYKDRLLMERDPHQLIEGCLITCYALGLNTCFLYVRGEMALAQERIAEALNEARLATARDGDPFLEAVVQAWREDAAQLTLAIEAGLDHGHDVRDYWDDPDVGSKLAESDKLRPVREAYPDRR